MLWKAQIILYFCGQQLFGYLDGFICTPAAFLPNSIPNPTYHTLCQQDQLIHSTLLSSLSENIISQVHTHTTSHVLRIALEKIFTSHSLACIVHSHLQLTTTMKCGLFMVDYFHKIKGFADLLATAGQPLHEHQVILYLLVGLGPDYDPFVTFVTAKVDPLSLDDIYGHLLSQEVHLEQHSSLMDLSQPYLLLFWYVFSPRTSIDLLSGQLLLKRERTWPIFPEF